MELAQFKKQLKGLGFKFTTKTFGFGRMATYHHLESGEALKGDVFTPDTIKKWQPLFDFLNANKAEIKAMSKDLEIGGLAR